MPLILRTKKDDPQRTLAGVGRMPANGVGGLSLELAALTTPEFQNDKGDPLEGPQLKKAADKFAKDRGLEVADVSDEKIRKLPELNGGFPDPAQSPVEAAQSDPLAQYASTGAADEVAGVVDPTQDEHQPA